MRVKLTIDVVYDDATVRDKVELCRALSEQLAGFIDRGGLTPVDDVVVDEVESGVESPDEG